MYVSVTGPQPWPRVVGALYQCVKTNSEDEIMTDERGVAPPGYVYGPKDILSSAGEHICNLGHIMMVWFLVLWLERPCRQEPDLISIVETVGSPGNHFKEAHKRQ